MNRALRTASAVALAAASLASSLGAGPSEGGGASPAPQVAPGPARYTYKFFLDDGKSLTKVQLVPQEVAAAAGAGGAAAQEGAKAAQDTPTAKALAAGLHPLDGTTNGSSETFSFDVGPDAIIA